MRTRVLLVLLGSSAAVAAFAVACVGDAGTASGPAVGELGGACFANGTCNGALVCVLTGSVGKCDTASDAASDTGAKDQNAPDAIIDAGADVFDAGPQCATAISPPPYTCGPVYLDCIDDTTSAHSCVASSNACLNSSYATPLEFNCFSEKECKNGNYCCTAVAQLNTTGCPGQLKFGASGGGLCGDTIQTPGTCPAGQRVLCSANAGCPDGGKCWPVVSQDPPSLSNQSFGICL